MIILIAVTSSGVVPFKAAGAASSPKLSEKKVTIDIDTKGYKIKVMNVDREAVVRFTSSDKSILKVSKKSGKVTPISTGSAKVTVKIKLNGKTVKLKQKITIISGSTSAGTDPADEKDTGLTVGAFSKMMSDVIEKADPSLLAAWKKTAKKALNSKEKLQIGDARMILYEAACSLGMGNLATQYWLQYNYAYESGRFHDDHTPNADLFSNSFSESPFEDNLNHHSGFNYMTSAYFYSLGYSSPSSDHPFFSFFREGSQDDFLTVGEAKTAADRLYEAYCCLHEGSFDIRDYETDWNDPALAEAAALKDSIINSKTNIKKGSVYIQGETYSGNAYYVSPNGNDSNDGLSPDSPWKSMEKVSTASLKYGDAVFFERGGKWNGKLNMQTGVTYSAYGEGEKPVWTGSPLDAAESSKWSYYADTADGGKIWKYSDKLTDCGVLILDGYTIARKAYPVWNGSKYITSDGKRTFDLKKDLSADLMYCSRLDLKGLSTLPCTVWNENRTGDLFFRCDKGNPGEVFSTIEIGLGTDMITASTDGYNTVDNICFRCFAMSGMGPKCHDLYQYCESCWCGGQVQTYSCEDGTYITGVSGGGALLFGQNIIARNNYIHDCENKGMCVVNNGESHDNLDRHDILAENNIVERCGNSVYMLTLSIPDDVNAVFEDITFRGNYFINSGKGWRAHSQMWIGNGFGSSGSGCEGVLMQHIERTGTVTFDNNLFYQPKGSCISIYTGSGREKNDSATFKNNRYICRSGSLFYVATYMDDINLEKYALVYGSEKEMKNISKTLTGETGSSFEIR